MPPVVIAIERGDANYYTWHGYNQFQTRCLLLLFVRVVLELCSSSENERKRERKERERERGAEGGVFVLDLIRNLGVDRADGCVFRRFRGTCGIVAHRCGARLRRRNAALGLPFLSRQAIEDELYEKKMARCEPHGHQEVGHNHAHGDHVVRRGINPRGNHRKRGCAEHGEDQRARDVASEFPHRHRRLVSLSDRLLQLEGTDEVDDNTEEEQRGSDGRGQERQLGGRAGEGRRRQERDFFCRRKNSLG